MRNLIIPYVITLVAALSITVNCAGIGGRKIPESAYQTYMEYAYYPNGQQEYAAQYLNGKLDGMSRYWSEDGFLISESEYSNGKLHGFWKKYYPNQNIMFETRYFHGQKHGKEKWYYEDGQIKSEQTYHYGEPVNIIMRWRSDGSIIY